MNCPACGRAAAAAARFCAECGAGLGQAPLSPTQTMHGGEGSAASPSQSATRGPASAAPAARSTAARSGRISSSSDSADYGQFIPGTLVAERYRVLGLLGRGGMGEVYRADDLRLGQTVALKFLPPDLAQDAGRLARFNSEVRLARQVSHPNVCRVYDIGEIDGQTYLSMEFIDGEDLATLLRRIGRLPKDKAIEIARQLCAGLAAAHDRGVLHRDLKPANVMIDGRGRARIADFGLAGMAEIGETPGTRAGTPAYMAPEQLATGETTVRSDVYALGLVLYELFTGKRAFEGESLAEMMRSREETDPPPPSSLVEGFDPAVERVILRCLERDPRQRPPSALAVAASLPGGDPLAMALAAGETPSPEMVAASGATGGLRPMMVWACLATIVLGIALASKMASSDLVLFRVKPPKPAAVLLDRAQEVARLSGYTDPPAGIAYGFGWHRTYMEHVRDTDATPSRWDRLSQPQPAAIYFWYRQSPAPLEPLNAEGFASLDDPPLLRPGMLQVMLTTQGDLWRFDAVPPQLDEPGNDAEPVEWDRMFTLAGLKREALQEAKPRWTPQVYAGSRSAWDGTDPGSGRFPLRVEAAGYRGKPVAFNIYWPWNRPLRAQPFQPSAGEKLANNFVQALIIAALVAAIVLARRNLRLGRVDRKGAYRLASAIFAASALSSLLVASHFSDPLGEWGLLTRLCGPALFQGFEIWVYYVALEPTVRRVWPDRIVSWTRLLGGRIGDSLVGRDALVGIALGVVATAAAAVAARLPVWAGHPPPMPTVGELDSLAGPLAGVAILLKLLLQAISISLVLLLLLMFMRLVLRRRWAAALGAFAIVFIVSALNSWKDLGPLAIVPSAIVAGLLTLALVRAGVFALVMALLTSQWMETFPLSPDWGAWYAGPGILVVCLLAAMVVFAARAALAGRSLLDLGFTET